MSGKAGGYTKKVFGQATRYQRQQGNQPSHSARELSDEQERAQRNLALKLKRRSEDEAFDERNGYPRFHRGSASTSTSSFKSKDANVKVNDGTNATKNNNNTKRGWVFNMLPTVSTPCMNVYFLMCMYIHDSKHDTTVIYNFIIFYIIMILY